MKTKTKNSVCASGPITTGYRVRSPVHCLLRCTRQGGRGATELPPPPKKKKNLENHGNTRKYEENMLNFGHSFQYLTKIRANFQGISGLYAYGSML
jgi:hypothetical protein